MPSVALVSDPPATRASHHQPANELIFYDEIRLVIIAGRFVRLSPSSYALLRNLASGRVSHIDRVNLAVAVHRLRRVLTGCGLPDLVLTERAQGYRLGIGG